MSKPSKSSMRAALSSAVVLLLVGVLAAAALSFTRQKTEQRIADNEYAYAVRQLNELIAPTECDNDLLNDFVKVRNKELLGGDEERTAYRAFRDGEPIGAVVTTVAPNGYSGPIKILVGVYIDGSLAGVRLVSHRETPGLGDKIELRKTDWLLRFDGRGLGDPPIERWKVRRDGGNFDQFTGATVTPRAVIAAVRDALIYFETHREDIFRAPERID